MKRTNSKSSCWRQPGKLQGANGMKLPQRTGDPKCLPCPASFGPQSEWKVNENQWVFGGVSGPKQNPKQGTESSTRSHECAMWPCACVHLISGHCFRPVHESSACWGCRSAKSCFWCTRKNL